MDSVGAENDNIVLSRLGMARLEGPVLFRLSFSHLLRRLPAGLAVCYTVHPISLDLSNHVPVLWVVIELRVVVVVWLKVVVDVGRHDLLLPGMAGEHAVPEQTAPDLAVGAIATDDVIGVECLRSCRRIHLHPGF